MARCSRRLLGSTLALLAALILGAAKNGWLGMLGVMWKASLLCPPGPNCAVAPEVFGWDRLLFPWSVIGKDPWVRLLKGFEQRALARLETGGVPLVVHVGPNTLDERDVRFHEHLANASKGKGSWVFVEPQAPVLEELRRNMAAVPAFAANSSAEVRVLNAALCPSSTEFLVMYTFAARLYEEHPWALEAKFNHHVSFNRSALIGNTKAFRRLPKELAELPEEGWLPYTEELRVRCATPSSLLSEVGATPADLDVLVIDAEGYDVELLSMFVSLGDFKPSVVVFEWTGHDTAGPRVHGLAQMVRTLASRGYEVHKHINDLVAFLPTESTQ